MHHRSDHAAGKEEEAAFLSNLESLWRGLIHMHAVAKFVTKAFPVSGTVDNLTEVKWTKLNLLRVLLSAPAKYLVFFFFFVF